MAANVKFIRTSKEKQNNRQLTNQFDHSALYFVTDSKQLYRADQLLTSGIRVVDNYWSLPSLETAAEEILYFTRAQGNCYTLQPDRSDWLLVFNGNSQSPVLFSENRYVTKPIGGFVLGQNISNLTIQDLFDTLLGLSATEPSIPNEPDTPENPDTPDTPSQRPTTSTSTQQIINFVSADKTPVYSFDQNLQLVESVDINQYNNVPVTGSVGSVLPQTLTSGFYVIKEGDTVIQAGVQHYTEQRDMYYTILLPDFVIPGTNAKIYTWDGSNEKWAEISTDQITSDRAYITQLFADAGLPAPQAPEGYVLYIDLTATTGDPGSKFRYILI